MPPPLLPLKTQNGHPPVSVSHSDLPYSINRSPVFDDTQANSREEEDFRRSDNHVPRPEYPFMSEEEKATKTARFDEAMAEIRWLCEPFVDFGSNFSEQPPMDLSAELIEELGISVLFPTRDGGKGQRNEDAMPNPVQTMPAWNGAQQTPMLSKNRGTKRKESGDDQEDFQQVQLDVERQGHRPIKRVKSVHTANLQNNTAFYPDAAYNSQQQQHFAPQYQSGFGPGQPFGGPPLQGGRHDSVEWANPLVEDVLPERNWDLLPQSFIQAINQVNEPIQPQQHTPTPFGTSFSDPWAPHQPCVASPYIPTYTMGAQAQSYQSPYT